VQILYVREGEEPPEANDARWTLVLPQVALGPSARHFFAVPETQAVNCVKLNIHPDGGIARFRVYGGLYVGPALWCGIKPHTSRPR